jgi:NtrC-family two-component system sensor histidine kinase KinB
MLRWRLSIGLVAILVLLLAVGGYSIFLFGNLGRAVADVLQNNYDSIQRVQAIRLAMARTNVVYLRPSYEQLRKTPLDTFEEHHREMERQMQQLLASSNSEQEYQLADKLLSAGRIHTELYREMLSLPPKQASELGPIRSKIISSGTSIIEISQQLIALNEKEMFDANKRANQLGRDSKNFMIVALTLAACVSVYTYYRLGNSIIDPIIRLTRSIEEVRKGNFEQVLSVKSNDELGMLSRTFNEMAIELRNYRHQIDARFMELNRVNHAMLATLPYPLLILNEFSEIRRMNPAAERLLENLNLPGRLPSQIRHHLDQALKTDQDYLPDDLTRAILFRINDEEVFYLPRIFRIVMEDGTTSGRAIMLVDITRFRFLDDMKSNMLSTVSHEIKTPLTGIRMALHILLEKKVGSLNPDQEEMVASARLDCERLLKTLNTLLDLARMENGATRLDLQPVSPADVIEDARRTHSEVARDKNQKITAFHEEGLPSILADRIRIGHVLNNFLSNAIKYAPEGSDILLKASARGSGFVRFSVINTGEGLEEEEAAHVFDKFYRAPSTRRGDGVGLGLAIAREVVEAQHGRIGVDSEKNVRTEFWCDIPVS